MKGRIRYGGKTDARPRMALISFETHREWIARDEALDAARHFSGRPDEVETARAFLGGRTHHFHEHPIFHALTRPDLLDRPFRTLSTGEIRRLLVAQALLANPELLILDEPFDGLDTEGRNQMRRLMTQLATDGTQLVVVTHRWQQLPDFITHTLVLAKNRVVYQGPKKDRPQPVTTGIPPHRPHLPQPTEPPRNRHPETIRLESVAVGYGDTPVLRDVNWHVSNSDHWVLLGPNGAGKSTLIRVIIGDHPQAYANRIHLFGKRRGSGESIWDIKKRVGMVSAEFQIRYRRPLRAKEVVASGFFDSVGLYRRPTTVQWSACSAWMDRFGIGHLADRLFPHLSRGEQRLILLARALVKPPDLLVLDEPCQGLDPDNRRHFLAIVDEIGHGDLSQMLYVTHYSEDIPSCFRHMLRFVPSQKGGFTTRSESLASDSG